MLVENTDFELVPNGDDAWQVRFLSGDFTESVIQFGAIRLKENGTLKYNFDLHSSPIDTNENNPELQRAAGAVLMAILEDALKET